MLVRLMIPSGYGGWKRYLIAGLLKPSLLVTLTLTHRQCRTMDPSGSRESEALEESA